MWQSFHRALMKCAFPGLCGETADMHQYFPSASPLAIDLLDRLLAFDPGTCPSIVLSLGQKVVASRPVVAVPLLIKCCWRMLPCIILAAKRLTVAQALAHPWLASLHDPNDEPVCDQVRCRQIGGQLAFSPALFLNAFFSFVLLCSPSTALRNRSGSRACNRFEMESCGR